MPGPKTHEQQKRILERKPDIPDERQMAAVRESPDSGRAMRDPDARQSEFPTSRGGMNQESVHNKHNDKGQPGHKPQKHSAAEQKKI